MSDRGWIKIYRKMQDCWIWEDKEPFDKRSAWIDLLLTANHSDTKILFNGELIVVNKGQILTSIRKLSDRWKWSYDKCVRFLNLLQNDGMLRKECDKSRTLLTIENYGIYQDVPSTLECTDRTPISEPTEHPQVINKNVKNDKKVNNIDYINNIYNKNNIQNNLLCSTGLNEKEKSEEEKNFNIIYNSYPKKVGKAKGYEYYLGWLRGRMISKRKIKLTNRQIWSAIAKYKHQIEENETEYQYIKDFSTFMCKSILDYVEDEN